MAELLLELLSEEIPARMQRRAAEDLRALVTKGLVEADLAFEHAEAHATPRRLVLAIEGLAARQEDKLIERRGPKADAPEKARAGFLKSLDGVDYRLEERPDKKGPVLYAVIERKGRSAGPVAAEIVADALSRFPWPKSMRWGTGEARWVRPLQSILFLVDGAVPDLAFAGIKAGRRSRGHRFMAPAPFEVQDFASYQRQLREARVILDREVRRAMIEEAATELACNAGYSLVPDPALLDEIAGLVEWPTPFLGAFDPAFLDIPAEALIGSMREHQKVLALRDPSGALAPAFVGVANRATKDAGAVIRAGAEKVLRARLFDAKFFYESDAKVPLEARLPALDAMVFHDKLGTTGERAQRLERLSAALAPHVAGAIRGDDAANLLANDAGRAGRLAKADLVSAMVGEFPELQGIMGGRYARLHGERAAVADAIEAHYRPAGPKDACPSAPASVCVALADKLDALAGFFAVELKPTGSKDPFALRRAALGVMRLALENDIRLPLRNALGAALDGYGDRFDPKTRTRAVDDLIAFFHDRAQAHLEAEGVKREHVRAVLAAGPEDDLLRLVARAEALAAFLASDDGANLLAGLKRAANIVRIEEKKDGGATGGAFDARLAVAEEEKALAQALDAADGRIAAALSSERYAAAMAEAARLRQPVDAFFDAVLVNDEDPAIRANRLALLRRMAAALAVVADFSELDER